MWYNINAFKSQVGLHEGKLITLERAKQKVIIHLDSFRSRREKCVQNQNTQMKFCSDERKRLASKATWGFL